MLTSLTIAFSVAISFHTALFSSEAQPIDTSTPTVDVSEVSTVATEDDRFIYTPFVDGFDLPESPLDRIARTA